MCNSIIIIQFDVRFSFGNVFAAHITGISFEFSVKRNVHLFNGKST